MPNYWRPDDTGETGRADLGWADLVSAAKKLEDLRQWT
jgi:hypothetical protein